MSSVGSSTNKMQMMVRYDLRERVKIFREQEIEKPMTSRVSPKNVLLSLIAFLPLSRLASAVEAKMSAEIKGGGRQPI